VPDGGPTLTLQTVLRHLRELIAALDRRAPRTDSAAELMIAVDAAALRARAFERIEELERRPIPREEA
jgi:hypothetical protein